MPSAHGINCWWSGDRSTVVVIDLVKTVRDVFDLIEDRLPGLAIVEVGKEVTITLQPIAQVVFNLVHEM
jgi:hypothetical protein